MATREEKFKAFLQSLPEDKRQQLFVYLKNLNPTDRVKAIDTIIARTESGKASVPTARQPAAPQKPAPATNPTPVQKPQNASPVQSDMRSASRPSASQAPNVAPIVKPVAPSRPANSQATKPTNNQHRPNPEVKKASSSSATVISSKTKRDLLIVAVVLVVFTGICFAAKYFIDKKLSEGGSSISFVIGENLKEQTNRSRASRKNTKRNKQINGFIIMCVEMYSKYKGLSNQRTYSLLKENNILNMFENDYDDLHGMGTEWLNNYIDSLVVV